MSRPVPVSHETEREKYDSDGFEWPPRSLGQKG